MSKIVIIIKPDKITTTIHGRAGTVAWQMKEQEDGGWSSEEKTEDIIARISENLALNTDEAEDLYWETGDCNSEYDYADLFQKYDI